IQYVGDKTFVLNKGIWMDTTFDTQAMHTTLVAFQGDNYYKLLDARPEWGRYFALGSHLIVVLDGTPYEISDSPSPQAAPIAIPPPLPQATTAGSSPQSGSVSPTPDSRSQVVPQPTIRPVTSAAQSAAPAQDSIALAILIAGIGTAICIAVGGWILMRR